MTAPTTPTAHTLSKNTFVGTPKITGGIFLVPQTVTLPTDALSDRPAECIRLGGVSEDGYTYMSERTTEPRKDWNGQKVRSLQTSMDDMFEVTFIEFLNPELLAALYGTDNVTVTPADATNGTQIAVRHSVEQMEHGAYIIDTYDGKVRRRRVIPDAQLDKLDPITEKPGDWSVYKCTFSIYPDSQGYTSYVYTVLNDATVTTPLKVDAKVDPAVADAKAEANKAAAQAAADAKAEAAVADAPKGTAK
jgi:hypothetical protein